MMSLASQDTTIAIFELKRIVRSVRSEITCSENCDFHSMELKLGPQRANSTKSNQRGGMFYA